MDITRVSGSLNPAASAMQASIPELSHVNVPTHEQAAIAVAQVRDALASIYLSSQSMRARVTSSNHVNDRPMAAYRLLTESTEAQKVVTEVARDPIVFGAICGKLQGIPVFRNLVLTVKRIKEEATSCLIPRDREVLVEEDEISSFADHTSGWVCMFNMVVEVVSGVWNSLVDLFASAIPRIQAAFAGEGGAAGDSHTMETAIIITGLVVLVTAVIIVGPILVI